MGIAIGGVIVLLLFLLLMRQTRFYVYLWVPLAANLLAWAVLGGLPSLAVLIAESMGIGAKGGVGAAGSLGMVALVIGVVAVYLLVLALATIAVFPSRTAWTKRSVRISLTIAVVAFVSIGTLLFLLVRRFP